MEKSLFISGWPFHLLHWMLPVSQSKLHIVLIPCNIPQAFTINWNPLRPHTPLTHTHTHPTHTHTHTHTTHTQYALVTTVEWLGVSSSLPPLVLSPLDYHRYKRTSPSKHKSLTASESNTCTILLLGDLSLYNSCSYCVPLNPYCLTDLAEFNIIIAHKLIYWSMN